MDKAQHATLAVLAALLKDHKLEALRQAAARQAQTRTLIAGLEAATATNLDPIPAAQSQLRHAIWAEGRRRELNQQLARQLVELEEARAAATRAFGRVQALDRLASRKM